MRTAVGLAAAMAATVLGSSFAAEPPALTEPELDRVTAGAIADIGGVETIFALSDASVGRTPVPPSPGSGNGGPGGGGSGGGQQVEVPPALARLGYVPAPQLQGSTSSSICMQNCAR